MAFNLLVVVVTLVVGGFVLAWVLRPGLRPWFEAPKYRVVEQERRRPEVRREG